MSITVLSQTTPSGSQFPEDLAAIEEEPGKSETEARNLVQGLNGAKIKWQADAGKTCSIAQLPRLPVVEMKSLPERRKYLRTAYPAAREIRISE
jgi:hypothetical protein